MRRRGGASAPGGPPWVQPAELDPDLQRFPSAGRGSGDPERAGTRQRGQTRQGRPGLRPALVEAPMGPLAPRSASWRHNTAAGERADELRAAGLRRKQRRAALAGTPLVDPRLFQQAEVGEDVLVRGTPGSPGVAEGPVRVARGSAEFGNLRAGEVLVAPYTNPAWTPLFQRAAAVVVDSGGAGSHAAIVAREYGIPAVMGTAPTSCQTASMCTSTALQASSFPYQGGHPSTMRRLIHRRYLCHRRPRHTASRSAMKRGS